MITSISPRIMGLSAIKTTTKPSFKCLFINKRTNEHINKEFTVAQIDKYLGEYIKDRAIKRGHTTTTVVKRGDNWKVTITYSK